MMRNLQVKLIQLDEQWDFIGKKQKRVRDNDPTDHSIEVGPEFMAPPARA